MQESLSGKLEMEKKSISFDCTGVSFYSLKVAENE